MFGGSWSQCFGISFAPLLQKLQWKEPTAYLNGVQNTRWQVKNLLHLKVYLSPSKSWDSCAETIHYCLNKKLYYSASCSSPKTKTPSSKMSVRYRHVSQWHLFRGRHIFICHRQCHWHPVNMSKMSVTDDFIEASADMSASRQFRLRKELLSYSSQRHYDGRWNGHLDAFLMGGWALNSSYW
jgi:hypothetical protein